MSSNNGNTSNINGNNNIINNTNGGAPMNNSNISLTINFASLAELVAFVSNINLEASPSASGVFTATVPAQAQEQEAPIAPLVYGHEDMLELATGAQATNATKLAYANRYGTVDREGARYFVVADGSDDAYYANLYRKAGGTTVIGELYESMEDLVNATSRHVRNNTNFIAHVPVVSADSTAVVSAFFNGDDSDDDLGIFGEDDSNDDAVFVGADDHDSVTTERPFGFGAQATNEEKRQWAVEMGIDGKQVSIIATRDDVFKDNLPLDAYCHGEYANLYREANGYAKLGSHRFNSAVDAVRKSRGESNRNWIGVVQIMGDMPVFTMPAPQPADEVESVNTEQAQVNEAYGSQATNNAKRAWAIDRVFDTRDGQYKVLAVCNTLAETSALALPFGAVFANLYREAEGFAKLGASTYRDASAAFGVVDTSNSNWIGVALIAPAQ